MENDVNVEKSKADKMGATTNNVARLTTLQERKKQIEDNLVKRTQELRQLCIQEAELTGLTPPEMPLEPGETFPSIRRRIGTSYQLPENLVKNVSNKDEAIMDLELQVQVHANMAEAAKGLANDQNLSKTIKRQHRNEYQKHKNECLILQEKIDMLKERNASEHHKQKKKLPVHEFVDDGALNKVVNDPFHKSDIRHSMRSMKHSTSGPGECIVEMRHVQEPLSPSKHQYRNSDMPYLGYELKHEDILSSGFYRLSLNGYNQYMERFENSNIYPPSSYNMQHFNVLHGGAGYHTQLQHSPYSQQDHPYVNHHGLQMSPQMSQHSPNLSQHSPNLSQHSSHLSQHSSHLSQHSPHVSQHSPHLSQHSPHLSHHNLLHQNYRVSPHSSPQNMQYRSLQQPSNYPQYPGEQKYNLHSNHINSHFINTHMQKESSSSSNSSKMNYAHSIHSQPSFKNYQNKSVYRNPHQIQPHQQYEQTSNMASGLGGCWKHNESGGLIWCNSNTPNYNWQKDKRFGSLDRRKNKRVPKRISPNMDKSATLATVPNYHHQAGNTSTGKSQVPNRRSQDKGQLVRTQSLGSVGIQTVDSVYPSDTSSCGSEKRGFTASQAVRKNKEKEWLETCLDGPVSPTHSTFSSSQPSISHVLAPEEKYMFNNTTQQIPSPVISRPPLEIPAETNSYNRIPEPNIELFNNNIPKNCTIVQAGHCKPYHEETKPFEMSDFYKYSTKFKKSPQKLEPEGSKCYENVDNINVSRNLETSFEERASYPLKPVFSNSSGNGNDGDSRNVNNTRFEMGNVAVPAEMNAWYRDQPQNNNNTRSSTKQRTATLV